jgi:hypothetical protein
MTSQETATLGPSLEITSSTEGLKKLLNVVVDRLSKGLRLIPS